MSRKRVEIDEKQFNALCKIQCTIVEIAAVLNVDQKSIRAWCRREFGKSFSDLYKERRAVGAVSLRRAQWKTAVEDGNPTMQIWLGRNYLNQSENGIMNQEDEDHVPTEIVFQVYDASIKPDASNDTSV